MRAGGLPLLPLRRVTFNLTLCHLFQIPLCLLLRTTSCYSPLHGCSLHPQQACLNLLHFFHLETGSSMFTTSRGANCDGRGRRPTHRKNAVSSRVSLFSGITTSSGGSSGSGSTITPESVSRSRRAGRTNASLRQTNEQPAQVTIARRQSTGSIATATSPNAIDVFAFLEHDASSSFAAELDADSHHAVRQIHSFTPLHEESDLDCSTRSLHSDSGISIRDSSPESSHYRLHPKPVLDPLREEDSNHPLRRSPLKSHQHHPRMWPGRDDDTNLDAGPDLPDERYFDDSPETFYRDHTRSNGLIAARSVQAAHHDATTNLSGYDLLAARLSDSQPIEHPFRPLYRSFTRLNHRILLQLQDEISQMEGDLADLDEADARVRRSSTGQVVPESRRLNWQWHGSELHARRLELLGQIYVKVEQYSKLPPLGYHRVVMLTQMKTKPLYRSKRS